MNHLILFTSNDSDSCKVCLLNSDLMLYDYIIVLIVYFAPAYAATVAHEVLCCIQVCFDPLHIPAYTFSFVSFKSSFVSSFPGYFIDSISISLNKLDECP